MDIDHGLFSDVRGQITAVSGVDLTISFAASGANGAIEDIAEGDVIVQRGHPSSGLRQNLMYTTVSDSDAPFHRTITGVNSLTAFDELSNVVLQTGNLASLDSHDIVPASPGYGIYSDNAYLKGLIQAASGDIGGLTLAANAIYTGIIHTSDNYSASGTTLASDGGFHAENFYINADGVVGINQEQPHWVPKVASDTLRHSSDAQVETNSESYVIKKTIVFPNGLKGVARFKFSLAVEVNLASTADGAIYDGDDRIGTIQSTSSSSPVTKSEDITHDFAPGASCHLKIGTSDSDYAAYASNFRIYYSDGTPVVAVLSDWTLE